MGALLELEGIEAGYGPVQALFGLSFDLHEGEVVALMGRNGMGKTTTVRTICRLLPHRAGRLRFGGHDLAGVAIHRAARMGLGLVPEGRRCFAPLTVAENLGVAAREGRWTLGRIGALFPRLAERMDQRAQTLSGGEQQMLAISRALMLRPRLLLLDEPSFGLAPLIVAEIFRIMREINQQDKVSMLLVEQNATLALDLADHAYLLETGHVSISGPSDVVKNDENVRRSYLGI